MNASYRKIRCFQKRRLRSKKNLQVSQDRPRMVVFRSSRYLYVQVFDINNKVLVAVSSLSMKDSSGLYSRNNVEFAKKIGLEIGNKLKLLGVKKLAFDRNGYPYHGKVKAIADSCRESGIEF